MRPQHGGDGRRTFARSLQEAADYQRDPLGHELIPNFTGYLNYNMPFGHGRAFGKRSGKQ